MCITGAFYLWFICGFRRCEHARACQSSRTADLGKKDNENIAKHQRNLANNSHIPTKLSKNSVGLGSLHSLIFVKYIICNLLHTVTYVNSPPN